MISPTRPRCTPSGLIIMNVVSIVAVPGGGGGAGRGLAAAAAGLRERTRAECAGRGSGEPGGSRGGRRGREREVGEALPARGRRAERKRKPEDGLGCSIQRAALRVCCSLLWYLSSLSILGVSWQHLHLCGWKGVNSLFSSLSVPPCRRRLFQGFWHNPLRERERDYTYPALGLIQVLPGQPLADSKDETVPSLQRRTSL